MGTLSVTALFLFLVCRIRFCVADTPLDPDPSRDLHWVLSEVEGLKQELKSEVENRKDTEAKLKDEISKLKSELDLSKKEIETLKHKVDEYEMMTAHRTLAKLDNTIQSFDPDGVQGIQNGTQAVEHETLYSTNQKDVSTGPLASSETFQPKDASKDPTGDSTNFQYQGSKTRNAKAYKGQRSISSGVAFFARLSSHSPKLQPGQDIVFTDVVTNIGNGYHNLHGNFIAPVSGVYVFHTSLLRASSGHAHVQLVKNGQDLARLDLELSDSTASQTAIVSLDAGDDIAVKNADFSNMIFHGSHYSTFSGFLLYD